MVRGGRKARDPVLDRLRAAIEETGMSKSALAQRLGVTRAAVAGWLADLEGTEKPSARRFSFAQQPQEVQEAVALFLRTSVAELMSLSTSAGDSYMRLGPAELLSDASVRAFAAALGLDDPVPQHRRLASLVTRVPGVSGVHIVERVRGRRYPLRYGHYLVVQARLDAIEDSFDDIRTRIEHTVADERIPWSWEHGDLSPAISVVDRDGREVSRPVGSMISQAFSGTRLPRSPWLIPPASSSGGHPRLAVILTNPYGGGSPIAGCWAEAFGPGHVRDRDVVRRHWDIQALRGRGVPERGALLPPEKARDSAFVVHETLELLQSSVRAGAWLLSVEGGLLDHRPLRDALVDLLEPLVVVRLGEHWRRLAAWRLALAERGQRRLGRVLESGREGELLQRDESAILQEQSDAAHRWLREVSRWEDLLDEVLALREPERPTVRHTLDTLPDGYSWWVVEDGRWEKGTGEPPREGPLVMPDDVDGFQDSWTTVAAAVLDDLLPIFGYRRIADRNALLARMTFDPIRELLQGNRRRRSKATSRP